MKVLKFGGVSLEGIKGIDNAFEIVKKESLKDKIVVVFSARGDITDRLIDILELARKGGEFRPVLRSIVDYVKDIDLDVNLEDEYSELLKILDGVSLLGEYSNRLKARVLVYGELLSVKVISSYFNKKGLVTWPVNSGKLIKTFNSYIDADVDFKASAPLIEEFKDEIKKGIIPIVTGFFGTNLDNEICLLGRNGSNYTATCLGALLKVEQVQVWTHINGIYTADPNLVPDATLIDRISYQEAGELASFGAGILHTRSIQPLTFSNIPVIIKNTYNPENSGTLICDTNGEKGIKALTLIKDVSLVTLEGKGLYGKVGIDGRIFSALSINDISVRMISQASSERSIGFIVDGNESKRAIELLNQEFEHELENDDISSISRNNNVAIVSAVGNCISELPGILTGLNKNGIKPLLFANSVNSRQISLVVEGQFASKACRIIHSRIFGMRKVINLVVFGIGNVGGTFIDQIVTNHDRIEEKYNLSLNILAAANSSKVKIYNSVPATDWRSRFDKNSKSGGINTIIDYVNINTPENLVFVDCTSSYELTDKYFDLIKSGFDLVSANKKANTREFEYYSKLRSLLKYHNKQYLYETNVGAGLPLIDTIKHIHTSGDRIRKIRGVFSGTISYLFNTFSSSDNKFTEILDNAVKKGFTEPDPREDLCGMDVARKLLILAREIGSEKEISDVDVENLIPNELQKYSDLDDFYANWAYLDKHYGEIKTSAGEKKLRYVGQLDENGKLSVKLLEAEADSVLGRLKGADSIFEIFTDRYEDNPLIIQGAGAGSQVTAAGVFADVLRIGQAVSRF
ncbi:MAG: bifunctional aspartate kinase/homoserine dehydrogenase I [Candidatus Delongbacteria bacterium]|nr:bifunctional aspartate kinase/homoserine dehydrogenase I [Candidatus Delongbacteria bacterium]MBN2834850.1 bifunctional aspartate kinase/homoserine dehydrogenase I [Candidatus Delongbacteria bacterium]